MRRNRASSGHGADQPAEIPARGWWQITNRVKEQVAEDGPTHSPAPPDARPASGAAP